MYRSPREAHEARIYTGAYRVYGTIHLVPGAGTADLLNQERSYLLAGELLLPRGVRLSDFLSQAKPFQTLREAGLYLLVRDKPLVDLDPLERFPFLTVNLRLAEGVVEAPGKASDPRLTLFG